MFKHSAHERSIIYKLAEYLQPLFKSYYVDCEYNVDIDNRNDRKSWVSEKVQEMLKEKLKKIGKELDPYLSSKKKSFKKCIIYLMCSILML